jgi:biopolymer transport protein ExbB
MSRRVLIACVVVWVLGVGLGGVVYGQDVLADGAGPASVAEELTLWQLIRQGGITMIPLGLLSVAAVALVMRNLVVLKEDRLLRPELAGVLRDRLEAGDVQGAAALCRESRCLLTDVLAAGLERAGGGHRRVERMREAMEEAGTEQLLEHMKPISYLSTIGAVSPMLGLLGTVSGMIKAFQHISHGGMGKPEMLAADIGEALVTTATGLIIAIPAMLFYFYFKNSFMKTMATLGRTTGGLLDSLPDADEGAAR